MDSVQKKYKRYALLSIKYGPFIMAVFSSTKIFISEYYKLQPNLLNWINLILNIVIVVVFYILGKTFGYCWKHQSLCRTALWGYLFYAFFMLGWVTDDIALALSVFYLILVASMAITYKNI